MKNIRTIIIVFSLIALVLVGRAFLMKKSEPSTTVFVDTVTQLNATSSSSIQQDIAPSSSPHHSEGALSDQDKEQLQALLEIFKTKNDNDPRMDQLLRNLSVAMKAALRKRYQDTKVELRNERGTIAFLLGRELKEGRGTSEDVQFLKEVLMEKPCMSLNDCSKPATGQGPEEQHLEAIHETTAHYPQLMDLRYLKQALDGDSISPSIRAEIIAALESARNSPNPRVAQEAQNILNSLHKN